MTGYTERELLATDFPSITHPADRAENQALGRRRGDSYFPGSGFNLGCPGQPSGLARDEIAEPSGRWTSRLEKLVERAKAPKFPALALTDHGNLRSLRRSSESEAWYGRDLSDTSLRSKSPDLIRLEPY
jgi:hypothetical protein